MTFNEIISQLSTGLERVESTRDDNGVSESMWRRMSDGLSISARTFLPELLGGIAALQRRLKRAESMLGWDERNIAHRIRVNKRMFFEPTYGADTQMVWYVMWENADGWLKRVGPTEPFSSPSAALDWLDSPEGQAATTDRPSSHEANAITQNTVQEEADPSQTGPQ